MSIVNISNVMDEFDDLNAILEVCRGYTQADAPDTEALEKVLWVLAKRYGEIYKQLCSTT